MTIRNIILPAAGLVGALILPMAAQAQTPHAHPHNINQRLENQNDRVHQGNKDDQLTRREDRNLRYREDRIHTQVARDRFFHHGTLTYGERRHVNRELNRDSHVIYRLKHNDHVAP